MAICGLAPDLQRSGGRLRACCFAYDLPLEAFHPDLMATLQITCQEGATYARQDARLRFFGDDVAFVAVIGDVPAMRGAEASRAFAVPFDGDVRLEDEHFAAHDDAKGFPGELNAWP